MEVEDMLGQSLNYPKCCLPHFTDRETEDGR